MSPLLDRVNKVNMKLVDAIKRDAETLRRSGPGQGADALIAKAHRLATPLKTLMHKFIVRYCDVDATKRVMATELISAFYEFVNTWEEMQRHDVQMCALQFLLMEVPSISADGFTISIGSDWKFCVFRGIVLNSFPRRNMFNLYYPPSSVETKNFCNFYV